MPLTRLKRTKKASATEPPRPRPLPCRGCGGLVPAAPVHERTGLRTAAEVGPSVLTFGRWAAPLGLIGAFSDVPASGR